MRCFASILLLALVLPGAVLARPVQKQYLIEVDRPPGDAPAQGATSLSDFVFPDTTYYGGTYWAADSNRWEAIRDSVWTFDSGVGSAINDGSNPNKPVGYHQQMEGWYGIDQTLNPLPYFRRSDTCVISGSWSLWAGVTLPEANALCFASGQGYGNGWNIEVRKTFAYGGTGSVTLSYLYANDTEHLYDFSYALIDTTGNGSADDVLLATYDGPQSGTETIQLVPGSTLRSSAGNVVLKFVFDSDGSYSDEDGLNPTTCGAFAVDNVSLAGAINDFSDFETGDNGWTQFIPTTGVGDFSNIVSSATDLPPVVTFCPCGMMDSVLVFFDPLQEHPLDQDNIAASPWIDLKRNGDLGRPGKIITFSYNQDIPLASYIFPQLRARWYPSVCAATGLVIRTGWRDQSIAFPDFGPFCSPLRLRDYSGVIETGAEQVQIALGMLNLCRTAPFGVPCTGITNTTPWWDNVRFGVYGPSPAPSISILTFDFLQDNFAEDGTLNPASTGRIDSNTLKNGASPGPGTILRDTLVARGDGGNTEVRLVFRVSPGPFVNPTALSYYAGRWTAEPSIGPGWYSARMDTAEQGGTKSLPLGWMATYHEADPGFQGNDRSADLLDPSQLENEILPDHLFTPGSRIDYFVQARYIPPDPRNLGGTSWYTTQDTTGGRFYEVEILPSSMGADTTWNCTLLVDHHDDRNLAQQMLEEAGITASLGMGSNNHEGTRYDRWDVETPSSGQMSFGRPIQTNYGASIHQVFAYKNILWHSAGLSSVQLTDEDANILGPWLTLRGGGSNRFWGSGDGLATSMNGSGEPSTVSFMTNILGVTRRCDTIRNINCPNPSTLDSTYCLPTVPHLGSHFFPALLASARGNGCPDLLSFDVLGANPAVTSARGQSSYVKNGVYVGYASVSNLNTVDVDYKTVLDGFAIGQARTSPMNPSNQALCNDTAASLARTDAVLDWFGSSVTCGIPTTPSDVPIEEIAPPRFRTSLGNAHPNPMSPATRISFTTGGAGERVTLQVFDVTGRLVRTLADGPHAEGVHEISWDGRSDAGEPVTNGMYFYRLTAPGYQSAKKLLVMR